jgi:protein disulfide-isomerase A6
MVHMICNVNVELRTNVSRCGHCQNLKPSFEKAAKSLTGLAKVAAINCDEESNKPFCGSMGVQGFPTLKIVKPGKKPGKPIVDDYRGERTAKAIVDAVIEKIPNHVKRLKDDDFQDWLEESNGPKAILFSNKGTTSATLKAISVDFLGAINVAQIRETARQAIEVFHVEKFPTLVLLPGNDKDPVTYDGEMKKEPMVKFLSQAASPNPDPAPKKAKVSSSSKSDKSKASKASSSFSKASESQASKEAKTGKPSQAAETLEDESQPTESPDPKVATEDSQKPVKLPEAATPIQSLPDGLALQHKCLNTKAGTCILALLPEETEPSQDSLQVIASLSEIHHKHEVAKRNLFPFYQLPNSNSQASALRDILNLGSNVELVAVNGKRAWYKHYPKTVYSQAEVEDWIDSIRMGEGAKQTVPEGLIVEREDLPPEPVYLDSSKFDQSSKEAMKESVKEQMPQGVEFEVDEIDDDEYERIIAQAAKDAKEYEEKQKAKADAEQVDEHDEL